MQNFKLTAMLIASICLIICLIFNQGRKLLINHMSIAASLILFGSAMFFINTKQLQLFSLCFISLMTFASISLIRKVVLKK